MELKLSDLKFPETVQVTDQEINTSVLSNNQREEYIKLFERILGIYESAQKSRVVIGLAGPTGSGKSVIASLFKQMASQLDLPFHFETIGIDAFHYPNSYLLTHEIEGKTLKEFKGRFDTYDVVKLTTSLKDFKEGKTVSLPEYSRKTHDPVENAITISEQKTLLLIEGLWLLSDKDGWQDVGEYLDYSFFVDAKKDAVRGSVIQRHMNGGRSVDEASAYYDGVDSENFNLVVNTRSKASEIIPSYFYQ